MNPFINPNKREITLPPGCKDLIDVLKQSSGEDLLAVLKQPGKQSAIQRFIQLILEQARQDNSVELVIGTASGDRTPLKYRVGIVWHDGTTFPSRIHPEVVNELARQAQLPAGKFSLIGKLEAIYNGTRTPWTIYMPSMEGECTLLRV